MGDGCLTVAGVGKVQTVRLQYTNWLFLHYAKDSQEATPLRLWLISMPDKPSSGQKRGPKGQRNRIRYNPYVNEKKWFQLKHPRRKQTPLDSATHPVFLCAQIAQYKAPRTVDFVIDG